jgi:hypothetical protein
MCCRRRSSADESDASVLRIVLSLLGQVGVHALACGRLACARVGATGAHKEGRRIAPMPIRACVCAQPEQLAGHVVVEMMDIDNRELVHLVGA